MEPVVSPAVINEIEEALSQVSEIRAARVVTSPAGVIEEIHVLALPSKSPKQLVRDIESTLMAAFGIAVDHKKISIAQLGHESVPQPTDDVTAPARAKIKSINAEAAGVYVNITVTLELGGDEYAGRATGPASTTGRQRLVAEATLDAIGQYLQGAFTFALEDVEIIRLGRESVAVACVVLVTSLGEHAFAGSALVRQNDKDSIVRATLDAINRRLGFLTTT
ncbi:MAG: hypothetical protein ISP10_08235 [Aeromicrobium sp.]|jgi:hypothetical protein|nr:hypothetical protein [Aeromicrobium sp.]